MSYVDATLADFSTKNDDFVAKDNSNSSTGVAKERQLNSPMDLGDASLTFSFREIKLSVLRLEFLN